MYKVLKARRLDGSAFCNSYRLGVPEQALCGIHLGFGIHEVSCVPEKCYLHVPVLVTEKGAFYFLWCQIDDRIFHAVVLHQLYLQQH